jgi:hypothetical protein
MGKIKALSGLKRPRVFIPLLLLVIAVAVVVIAVKNMSSPAQGSITQTPPNQAETIDPYAQSGTYKGKYITFNYPAHYKAVPAKLTGSYLEVADYHTTDSSAKQINVGVSRGSIDGDSGTVFRRQHKELYKENDSRFGVEFTRIDGTEDTFFMEHNGLLTTVSATSPYGGLNGEALFVASSLKWI